LVAMISLSALPSFKMRLKTAPADMVPERLVGRRVSGTVVYCLIGKCQAAKNICPRGFGGVWRVFIGSGMSYEGS
jgi:hypothetical protein